MQLAKLKNGVICCGREIPKGTNVFLLRRSKYVPYSVISIGNLEWTIHSDNLIFLSENKSGIAKEKSQQSSNSIRKRASSR